MKIFLVKIIGFFAILSAGLIGLYLIFDPNNSTIGDVRYIKTRNITSNENTYNTLLVGSSRVYDIGNISDCNFSIYNYGFIQAVPGDFPDFIKYAKENQPIKKIILGLDFYGSSKNGLNDILSAWKPSDVYVQQVKSENLYKRLGSMYDFPRFKRLINYKILGNDPFERDKKIETKPANTTWHPAFWNIYSTAYSNYVFNDSLVSVYNKIRQASGDAELIVYITPESQPLIQLMIDKKLQKNYEQFLKRAVLAFDTVYNYMEVNDFTTAPQNFKDESHLTNAVLHSIVCDLANKSTPKSNSRSILTSTNIDQYIEQKIYLDVKHSSPAH